MGKGGFHGAGCGGKARNFYCLGKKVVVHGRRSSRGPPARTFVGYFVCRFVVCPGCACPRSCGRVAHGTWGWGARGIVGVGPAAHARVGTV